MKPSNQLIVALVLIIIAAVGLGLVNREVIKPSSTPTPTERAKFLGDVLAVDITQMSIVDNSNNATFAAKLEDDGTWAFTKADKKKDTGLGIDQMRLSNAIAVLPGMIPSAAFSADDLSAFGLDKPAYTLTLTISGKDLVIQIGSLNPDETDFYVLRSDSKEISLVGSYNLNPLIGFITDPPYTQPTPDPNATPSLTPEPSATPTATREASATPAATSTP